MSEAEALSWRRSYVRTVTFLLARLRTWAAWNLKK